MEECDSKEIYTQIGLNISKYRKANRIPQEKLAEKVNLSRSSIVQIERAVQKIPIDKLYLVANVLGVSIYNLIPNNLDSGKIDENSKTRITQNGEEALKKILTKHNT